MRTFDPAAFPDRLNLGCGFDHREGYLNVDLNDFHDPDLIADVTDLHMLPDGSYREIIAQDVLEHLPRTATVPALREWSRLLDEGGLLRLRVPSVLDLAKLLSGAATETIERQEMLVQCLFGTQAYTEDIHLTTFTESLLRHYLEESDFRIRHWHLRDEWLFEVEAQKVSGEDDASGARGSEAEPVPGPRERLTAENVSLRAQVARLEHEVAELRAALGVVQNTKAVRWTVWPRRIVYRLRGRARQRTRTGANR